MNAVIFGNYHSFNDLQLILSQKTIGTPSPKVETVDIPGGDGVLDLTEFFGAVKYNNRTLAFDFSSKLSPSQFMEQFAYVQTALHGRKMNIILTDDPAWFYTGRVSVSEWKVDRNIGKLTIDCDCEPFKQSTKDTTITTTVKSNATIVLPNDQKPVVPKITTTAEFLISFNGYNNEYPAGTFTIPELELGEGTNQVYVEGNGTIYITYRKGRL